MMKCYFLWKTKIMSLLYHSLLRGASSRTTGVINGVRAYHATYFSFLQVLSKITVLSQKKYFLQTNRRKYNNSLISLNLVWIFNNTSLSTTAYKEEEIEAAGMMITPPSSSIDNSINVSQVKNTSAGQAQNINVCYHDLHTAGLGWAGLTQRNQDAIASRSYTQTPQYASAQAHHYHLIWDTGIMFINMQCLRVVHTSKHHNIAQQINQVHHDNQWDQVHQQTQLISRSFILTLQYCSAKTSSTP